MYFEVKRRKFILYSLIISVLLIQLVIALFFYNEYYNGKKLDKIENQIENTNQINDFTAHSKAEFGNAQRYLRKYFVSHDGKDLDQYFLSLNSLADQLSKFGNFGKNNPEFQKYFEHHTGNVSKLHELKSSIDSTQAVYKNSPIDDSPIQMEKLNVKVKKIDFEVKVEKKSDSLVKKGLFGRLSDAIKGKQSVKTDSVVITKNDGTTIDSDEINKELKDIIDKANSQYFKKVTEVQTKQKTIEKQYLLQYDLFDKLLVSSNNLLEAYDMALNAYKNELQNQYKKQENE